VTFTYKRPWEDEALKTERITFEVDGDAGGGKLTLAQAMEIATNSECGQKGTLVGEAFYNADTGTWWFDLDVKDDKEYCDPACVVNEATGKAEINWRCRGVPGPTEMSTIVPDTGALPLPEESLQIAKQFLLDSPSFDGVAGSVEYVHMAAARCPSCWAFIFEYETMDGTAKATIMVEQGRVTSANFGN